MTTGSVDTALVASDFFAERVRLGGFTLMNVPDVVIGPGSLEGRWSLSYDPIDRVVVLEEGPAAGVE